MINVNELKFDEKGLIPAVVVDSISKKVLTVAYMNRESLEITMEKGLTCFYSRSRQKLWLKGENLLCFVVYNYCGNKSLFVKFKLINIKHCFSPFKLNSN